MTTKAQEALDLALQLDRGERVALAARLLASVDDEAEKPEGWEEAWIEELDRRAQDGPEHWIDGEEAVRQVFRRPS